MTDGVGLRPRNGLSLFSGAGGLDMGLELAEPQFAARVYVEQDANARARIIAAQRAGYFAPAPIWDDVTTFDARPLRGHIDTVLGGYPCQPESHSGKRELSADPRWLWTDTARIIEQVGPVWCFFENVYGHVSGTMETVLRDLQRMGFRTAALLVSADEVGSTHERLRVFIVANAEDNRRHLHPRPGAGGGRTVDLAGAGGTGGRPDMADDPRPRCQGQRPERDPPGRQKPDGPTGFHRGTWLFPPRPGAHNEWGHVLGAAPDRAPALSVRDVRAAAQVLAVAVDQGEMEAAAAASDLWRMAHGLAARSHAVRLLGNGVLPLAAAHAWRSGAAALGLRPLDLGRIEGPDPRTIDPDLTERIIR